MESLKLFAECESRRDRMVNGAAVGIAFTFGLIASFDVLDMDTSLLTLAFVTVTGLASILSLLFRRRRPVAVGIVTVVLGLVSPLASGAFLVALLNAAIRLPWRDAAGLAILGLVSSPIYFVFYPTPDPDWFDFFLGAVAMSAVVAWGMYVRARRQLLDSLRDRAIQAEADRDLRLAQAREQERTRIAREMHDVLAHRISLVALNAGALEFRPDAPPEEIRQAAAVVRSNAHLALDELRDVIAVLRTDPQGELAAKEPPQPTLENVRALILQSRESGAEVAFEEDLDAETTVPDSIGRTAYRVVQEGLTNVHKHASGGSAAVAVSGSPGDGLLVEVRNRRPLVEAPDQFQIPGSGIGLIGLSERVELSGGRLDHGIQPDGQFRLRAWLPWSA